jgi:hypothetical protein
MTRFYLLLVWCLALGPGRAAAAPNTAANGAGAWSDPEWTLESADADGLRFRWTRSGPQEDGPVRPRSVALAVPPGHIVQAVLESPSQTGGIGGAVSVSKPSQFRDVAVAALTFEPAGASGDAGSVASARIRVSFRKSPAAPAFRAAFAAGEDTPAERHLKGWLANYAQSRGFRGAPVIAAAAKTSAAAGTASSTASGTAASVQDGPSATAYLPKRRLVIKTLGENIEALPYDTLLRAGLPLSGIDPRHMHLYHDGREVPMYIRGEEDGHWDRGDYIEFIGKRASGQNTYNSLYTTRAVFILTWEGGRLGLRAPAVPVASRTGGIVPTFPKDAEEALPFRVREHLEEDQSILRIGSTSAEEVIDLGSRVQEAELTDFWVWTRLGAEKDLAEIPFNLPYTPSGTAGAAVDPTGAGVLRVTINLKGITNNPKADPDHHLKFLLNGSDISLVGGVANDAIWEGQESFTWRSQPLSPSVLKAGKNVLVIQKVNDLRTTDGQLVEVQDAFLNSIDLEFPAGYAVLGNRLAFSNSFSDSAGLKLFTLTGFEDKDVSLWDKLGRKLTNFRMERTGSGYGLSFLDTLAGRTDYIACAMDKRELPLISLDTLPDLLSPSQGADYLVITQKELLGKALDSLLEFRTKQGLRTRVVLARHIYQAFGDGTLDPAAIRRFVAYAYRNWTRPAPTYLVLVGDASSGFDKRGETIVPFHPVNIRGWGVAANDDYFAKVSGDDDLADLFVGRLPAADKQQLSNMVRKTLTLEKSRPQGHWSNKALLISGFESSFMTQNYALQRIAVANDRQYSRLDLFPGSPHYKSAAQRTGFFDQLDSAFNLVSFVGHGGGAVWSDAGVLTLKALDEGRLKGDYAIPLVSSITCLTGFFEDITARSLGEELLRMPKGGAAGFYGAAGYISNLAGEALSEEVLKAAAGNGFPTIGAIVTQAETMVKLRTGDVFLPILAEFNLLGDPALGLSFPKREGALELSPMVLTGGASLEAKAASLAIESGDAVATILLGDSAESAIDGKVAGGKLELRKTFGVKPGGLQNGKVLINYWNDKQARVVSAPFSTLDWLIDSVAIAPADAAPGDSVRITLRLNTAYAKTSFTAGVASFVVGGGIAPLFPGDNQNGLRSEDGIHFATVSKVKLDVPAADLTAPRVYLAFRLNVQVLDEDGEPVASISNLSSRTYSLPLSELPRLELPAKAFGLPIQDKLGVWVRFHNGGVGAAEGFSVSLGRDTESPEPVTDTLPYGGKLGMGGQDSLFFPLADTMLHGKRLRASLIAARDGELAAAGRSQDTVFKVLSRLLSPSSENLALDTSGTSLSLPGSVSKTARLFAETVSITALPPHLGAPGGILPVTGYRIQGQAMASGGFELSARSSGLRKTTAAAAAAAPVAAWHFREWEGQTWVKLDTLAAPDSLRLASGFTGGVYALLINKDLSPPLIQLSSRGQALLMDDYVPLHTPIDIVIRDAEGVDLAIHPPELAVARQQPDSGNLAREPGNAFPTLARMHFVPDNKSARDSITITARDISGNTATRSLVYRMGDDLKIKDLGSYPNPFADSAVFVYSLTDYCDRVDLKVYSRAGRIVRSLEQRNVVGYQEVVWDGRAESGNNVANGLYFLKVTAKAGGKESSKIFKLFKKQRK